MRALLVTEKCSVDPSERDGGAQLVETLKTALGDSLSIMQFGPKGDSSATWHYEYPYAHPNRFERRLLNAHFIAERIKSVENSFTHVLFVHASMQFGLSDHPLKPSITVWTFPMFLTPSYEASGETVPATYYALEKHTLQQSKNILTPSHLEKQQLMALYGVPKECIHVVPRGVKNALITPKVRTFDRPLRLCSIGSIKPQKNTVGLVSLFGKIRQKYPDATLQIIGPVQNGAYLTAVEEQIVALNLNQSVEITGYVPIGVKLNDRK